MTEEERQSIKHGRWGEDREMVGGERGRRRMWRWLGVGGGEKRERGVGWGGMVR